MRKPISFVGVVVFILTMSLPAHSQEPVPVIPLCVTENVNVFVKEMDVSEGIVGAYVDLLARKDPENQEHREAAMEACKNYINAAIVPLVQTAISRSGTFWKYRGFLPVSGNASPQYDEIANLKIESVKSAFAAAGCENDDFVILEPSLVLVSGLRSFSGSFGFIINKFLELKKSHEWVYLALHIKAEVHRRGESQEVFSDFCLVPLAKWKRKKFHVGVDKRILAIVLSQISATGIVQEVLDLFQEELKAKDEDELAKIGFELVNAVCDPIQATAMAVYQSAYRITDRLKIRQDFRQRIYAVLLEETRGEWGKEKAFIAYADGKNVFIPDPLDIKPGSTKFRIFLCRDDRICDLKNFEFQTDGEIFATQPMRLEPAEEILKRHDFIWSDIWTDRNEYEKARAQRNEKYFREIRKKEKELRKEQTRNHDEMKDIGRQLAKLVKETPEDQRDKQYQRQRDALKAKIVDLGEEIREIQRKKDALSDLIRSTSSLLIKLDKIPDGCESGTTCLYAGWAEIAWDWYVEKFK